jgi:hypothetical protein
MGRTQEASEGVGKKATDGGTEEEPREPAFLKTKRGREAAERFQDRSEKHSEEWLGLKKSPETRNSHGNPRERFSLCREWIYALRDKEFPEEQKPKQARRRAERRQAEHK